MEEFVKAIKPIFEKLSDFFDIFDLSFFVSGFCTSLVFYVWAINRDLFPDDLIIKNISVFFIVLICYVFGILNFAFGRLLRLFINMFGKIDEKFKISKFVRFNKSDELLNEIITAHGLNNHPVFSEYIRRPHEIRGVWRLYVRLWARIRHEEELSNSFKLLKRYWVMAATYDGLSTTCVITSVLIFDTTYGFWGDSLFSNIYYGLFLAITFILLFFICKNEAKRYTDYQMEELIAVFADKHDLI